MDRMDRSGLHGPNWCELDQSGQKWTEVDRIEPNGPNRTKVDRIDRSGPNIMNWTELDKMGLKWAI